MFDLLLAQALIPAPVAAVAEVRSAEMMGRRVGFFYCQSIALNGVKTIDALAMQTVTSADPVIRNHTTISGYWQKYQPALYEAFVDSAVNEILSVCPAHWRQFNDANPK